MNTKLTTILPRSLISTLLLCATLAFAGDSHPNDSKADVWWPVRPFIGNWEGDVSGEPGDGKAERSYAFALRDQFIQVTNKSVYPPQEKNPKGEVHQDVGFISYDKAAKKFILRQFHVEGFVNQFALDDFPMKGKGVKHMRFTLADTTYGCHVSEFPPGCRSTFHRHGPGAVIIITQGEGYVVLWKDGEERQRHEFKVGTVYSPDDLMWHGHFNTDKGTMRHFAIRGDSPKYSHDRFRNPLWTMIPMNEEPPDIHREYVDVLKEKGVKTSVSGVAAAARPVRPG